MVAVYIYHLGVSVLPNDKLWNRDNDIADLYGGGRVNVRLLNFSPNLLDHRIC